MGFLIILILVLFIKIGEPGFVFDFLDDLDCPPGGSHHNSTVAPYYINDSDRLDNDGNILASLQDFLDGKTTYVTLAVDDKMRIPYRTKVCIASINRLYLEYIPFEIRDSSSELEYRGLNKILLFSKKYNEKSLNDVGIVIYRN